LFSSSCARLNWQLACQFFSAHHLSYRIVSPMAYLHYTNSAWRHWSLVKTVFPTISLMTDDASC